MSSVKPGVLSRRVEPSGRSPHGQLTAALDQTVFNGQVAAVVEATRRADPLVAVRLTCLVVRYMGLTTKTSDVDDEQSLNALCYLSPSLGVR